MRRIVPHYFVFYAGAIAPMCRFAALGRKQLSPWIISHGASYVRRTGAEKSSEVVQVVGCGVLVRSGKVFVFRRHDKNPKSRLYGKSTIWLRTCERKSFGEVGGMIWSVSSLKQTGWYHAWTRSTLSLGQGLFWLTICRPINEQQQRNALCIRGNQTQDWGRGLFYSS